jgi:ankyrin repeat protein
LANKAAVNVKDKEGITPLKRAMLQGQQDVMELLRQHERPRINLLETRYAA